MKEFKILKKEKRSIIEIEQAAKLSGQYRFYVLNEDGSEYDVGFKQGTWHKNLLTDGFMNQLPNLEIDGSQSSNGALRRALAIGTGTGAVRTDSGAITASQTGNAVTASAAIFNAGMVGADVFWDTGERAKITVFNSSTSVTVDRSQTVASGEFTVEFVSRTSLVTEVQRSLTADGNGGFLDVKTDSIVGNEYVYEFTLTRVLTLTASQNLSEFGLFTNVTSGGTLTVYELFRDTFGVPITITIPAGKKIRVDHKITVRIPYLVQSHKFEIERLDAANINQPVITAVTNASPIQITANAHGFTTGQEVRISGVLGNTAANGDWIVTVIDANNFTLDSSVGNGAYTSGGKVSRLFTGNCTLHGTVARRNMLGQWEPSIQPSRLFIRSTTGVDTTSNSNTLGTETQISSNFTAGRDAYTNDSFRIRKFIRLGEAVGNGPIFAWRFATQSPTADNNTGYKVSIDPASWTKIGTNTLEVAYLCTWARG